MRNLVAFTLLSLLFMSNCKVIRYSAEKLPVKQIVFGDGGGFIGVETSYILLENGQIFKKTGVGGLLQELSPIKQKQSKTLFEKLATVQLYKLDINKPGNLYYFLQETNNETDSRATWGAGDYLPPQSLVAIHRELLSIAKTRSPLKPEAAKTDIDKPAKKEEDKTKW